MRTFSRQGSATGAADLIQAGRRVRASMAESWGTGGRRCARCNLSETRTNFCSTKCEVSRRRRCLWPPSAHRGTSCSAERAGGPRGPPSQAAPRGMVAFALLWRLVGAVVVGRRCRRPFLALLLLVVLECAAVCARVRILCTDTHRVTSG